MILGDDDKLTLGRVLQNGTAFNPEYFLYLPFEENWGLGTECLTLPQSDVDGTPEEAKSKGFSYVVEIAAVQSVITNASAQIYTPSLDQLLEAFLFYYDHDAYIIFKR